MGSFCVCFFLSLGVLSKQGKRVVIFFICSAQQVPGTGKELGDLDSLRASHANTLVYLWHRVLEPERKEEMEGGN
jgi:hypothetical protein